MLDAANTNFNDICQVVGRLYIEQSLIQLQNQKHFDSIISNFKGEQEQIVDEVKQLREENNRLMSLLRDEREMSTSDDAS